MTEPVVPHVYDDPQPQPPREPEPWECCQSGCDPCIYDVYWQAVERYETARNAWEKRQSVRNGASKP